MRSSISHPGEWLRLLWVSLWWTRGAVAAISLVSLIPNITGFTKFEFLHAITAAIAGWNKLASYLGDLIGTIPFVPELSSTVINSIAILFTTIAPPLIYSASYILFSKEKYFRSSFVIFSLYMLFEGGRISYNLMVNIDNGIIGYTSVGPDYSSVFENITGLLFVAIFFIYSLFAVPNYAKGFFTVMTFLITLQILYFLNTPWLIDSVNNLSCAEYSEPDFCQ